MKEKVTKKFKHGMIAPPRYQRGACASTYSKMDFYCLVDGLAAMGNAAILMVAEPFT